MLLSNLIVLRPPQSPLLASFDHIRTIVWSTLAKLLKWRVQTPIWSPVGCSKKTRWSQRAIGSQVGHEIELYFMFDGFFRSVQRGLDIDSMSVRVLGFWSSHGMENPNNEETSGDDVGVKMIAQIRKKMIPWFLFIQTPVWLPRVQHAWQFDFLQILNSYDT